MTTTSGSVGGFQSDRSYAGPHNTLRKKIKSKSIRERVDALVNYAMSDPAFRREVRGVRESGPIIRALTEFAATHGTKLSYALTRQAACNIPSHRLWEAWAEREEPNTPEEEYDQREFDPPEADTDASSDEPPMIQAMRQIIQHKGVKTHKGQPVDMQTAHVILTVYAALSDANKKKLAGLSVTKAAAVCWKLVK